MTTQTTSNRGKPLIGMSLFASVFVVCFLYYGFQEMRYSLTGATAIARVTHKSQEARSSGKGGGTHQVLVLDYTFVDASGTHHTERDEVPLGWRFGRDETVQVEYLPGIKNGSRVMGKYSPMLVLGIVSVIGGFVVWLMALSNSKASEPMEPLVPSASVDNANETRAKSRESRADRRQKRGKQRRESNSPIHSPAVRNELGGPARHRHETDVPTFAPNSLVCRYAGWMGKPVSVIVDRSLGMIHFQNCFRLATFWAISTEPWFSCPLSQIKAAHHCNNKGHRSLVIATRSGKARISADASDYSALCDAMASFMPHGLRALHEDHPVVGCLTSLVGFGGLALGYCLSPNGVSDTTQYLISLGTGVVCLVLFFMGIKSLNR